MLETGLQQVHNRLNFIYFKLSADWQCRRRHYLFTSCFSRGADRKHFRTKPFSSIFESAKF